MKMRQNALMLFFFSVWMIFAGCSREEDMQARGGSNEVHFVVAGMEDEEHINLDATDSRAATNRGYEEVSSPLEEDFEDFSWQLGSDVVSERSSSSDYEFSQMPQRVGGVAPARAAVRRPMADGIRYRILFYEISGGREIYRESHEVAVSGSAYSVDLLLNARYRWYAYSYNLASAIPLPSNTSEPTAPTRDNAPFLFASGEFINNAQTARIELLFQHKIRKLEVMVDVRGIFADRIDRLEARFVNQRITTSDFIFRQGVVSSGPARSVRDVNDVINFTDFESSRVRRISTNQLYTTVSEPDVTVRFNALSTSRGAAVRDLITNATARNAHFVFRGSPPPTGVLRATTRIMQGGNRMGNFVWATGNLYYDAADPQNHYKFEDEVRTLSVEPDYGCNFYWKFETKLPRSETDALQNPAGDPCEEVYPHGRWQTPTEAAMDQLRGNNGANGRSGGDHLMYFEREGIRVYFQDIGRITRSTGCSTSRDNYGYYWTIDGNTNRTRGTYMRIRGSSGNSLTTENNNVDHGRGIRCVRSVG
ncbi:hypothetical protein M8998_01010 [Sphingobacterium sp. lm-10]|uniref:hypothetical protein n=1 Tax=Sphingobacterium sp. lm-10 TaxID=2944904 RepID=UPI00202137D9|nr:hypothetical protein [Sphingobacterium sp. lm-10]MCL7986509.1 hypothetical protein [Sphingobacterium sp. lm-10]